MKEPQHKTPAPDTAHTEKSPGSKPETSAADPKQGFDGILYPAKDPSGTPRTDKVVITLSGSEGGLQTAKRMARFLHQHNVPALALGYFRTEHTEKNLSRIPLEYIENAIRWLRAQGYDSIGICGISRGAEYAAAAAVHFPEITCTILKAPTWFYGEGLIRNNPSGSSCWTYRNQEFPYAPFQIRDFTKERSEARAAGDPTRGRREDLLRRIDPQRQDAAAIPLERANGPVLLFSTEADTVWPSDQSGRKLEERLSACRFPFAHKHVCFQYMSHIMLENASRFSLQVFESERAHPDGCARERNSMGTEMLRWIEEVW